MKQLSKKKKIGIVCVLCVALGLGIISYKAISHKDNSLETNIENLTYPVMEEDGYSIDFVAYRNPEKGNIEYCLEVNNDTDNGVYKELSYCVVNNSLYVPCDGNMLTSEHEKKTVLLDALVTSTRLAEIESIDTIDFYIENLGKEEGEEKYSISLSSTLNPGIVFKAYEGGKADEQVLIDTDQVKVTLKGLGSYQSSEDDAFNGLVLFENKSDYAIPIGIKGAKVNGMEFNVSSSNYAYLDPGLSQFVDFEIKDTDYVKVEDVSSVSLLVLSEEGELTGTVTQDGGSWYDVALSQSCSKKDEKIQGQLVYDQNDVQIYYQGQNAKVYSYDNDVNYYWNFCVVNNRDEDVELNLKDKMLDGKPADKDHYLGLSDKKVGSHSKRIMQASTFVEDLQDCPTISFRIQFRSRGGGEIFFETEEVFSFEPEVNGKDLKDE